MSKILISLKDIYYKNQNTNILKAINLKIYEGEKIALIGKSGAGKTTLISLINGVLRPTRGNLSLLEYDSYRFKKNQNNFISTIWQDLRLLDEFSAEQNVNCGLLSKKSLSFAIKNLLNLSSFKDAHKCMKLCNLDQNIYSKNINQLSGGQKQRVALARALILKPKVLLLDEPLSALDKKLREQMQSELRNLQKAVGITFILVTHDQEEALTMSDKIAVMFDGKVEQIASPKELYERPASRRVASFIGAMNFVNAVILESNGKVKVKSDLLGKFEISKKQVSGNHINKEITLGIRPELISINPEKSNSKSLIKGEIIEISYLGETTYYKIGFSKNNLQLDVAAQNSFGKINYEVGNKVKINIDKENIVGFV